MRAVALRSPGQVTVLEDWPEPTGGPEDVVVAVRGVGVCGSDLSVVRGHRRVPRMPWVLGHEAMGEVIAVGGSVADRHVGQRVVIEPNYACLNCPRCRVGATATCSRRRIPGMSEPGLLAERIAVPARFSWPVPADWCDDDVICIEPLAVAMSAVARSGATSGQQALVIGAGAQGLLVVLALLRVGVEPYVVDPQPGRMALAGELGGHDGDALDAPEGFRLIFETAGVPAALELAMAKALPDAHLALIGQCMTPVPLSTFELVRRRLTLQGCLIYDHPEGFAATIAAVKSENLEPGRVVRAHFSMNQAAQAFRAAAAAPGKSCITLTEGQNT